jgi:hypothetical protein
VSIPGCKSEELERENLLRVEGTRILEHGGTRNPTVIVAVAYEYPANFQ